MFGQYSAGGGLNRTKAEMIETFERQGYTIDPKQARKGGKNRLHFTCASGVECFTLHETVIVCIASDRKSVTFADGGWHTPTTKSAWGDARKVLKIDGAKRWHAYIYKGAEPGDGYWSTSIDEPKKHERSVTYALDGCTIGDRLDVQNDLPLIRADVNEGAGNFAVRYDGREIISDAGPRIRATPFKVLVTLYRVDKLARETHGMITRRGNALDRFYFDALGFTIHPGQTARHIMFGCHAFKTMDLRAMLTAIEIAYPHAKKPAKAFVRKNPLDYGVKAYEAEQRARYARIAA